METPVDIHDAMELDSSESVTSVCGVHDANTPAAAGTSSDDEGEGAGDRV